MAKVTYTISTGEGPKSASGVAVGRYLAVRTETDHKTKRYTIDHIPTGNRILSHDRLADAKKVAQTLSDTLGEMLAESDGRKLADQMRLYYPEIVDWISTSRDPDFERFRETRRAERERKQVRADLVRVWKGKRFHYVSGQNYGREGRITDVYDDQIDPQAVKVVVDWGHGRSSLGHILHPSEVAAGLAPTNMQWLQTDDKHVAGRVGGVVYRIYLAPSGRRATMWTVDVPRDKGGISEYEPVELASVDEAKDYAHGRARRSRTGNVTRASTSRRRSIVNPFG